MVKESRLEKVANGKRKYKEQKLGIDIMFLKRAVKTIKTKSRTVVTRG